MFSAPRFPRGLLVSHPALGEVVVTSHAWSRFCLRSTTKRRRPYILSFDSQKYERRLQSAFAQAKILEKSNSHRFRCLRYHKLSEDSVVYLIDPQSLFQFVVLVDRDQPVLVSCFRQNVPEYIRYESGESIATLPYSRHGDLYSAPHQSRYMRARERSTYFHTARKQFLEEDRALALIEEQRLKAGRRPLVA